LIDQIWPLAFRVSQSLKVIETNKGRTTTYDILLVIYSDCG